MAGANALDWLIGWFSPATAASRVKSRARMQHYDAAGSSYRTKGMRAPAGDANASNRGGLGLLRKRSRDLVRNNPVARRFVDALVNNVVGDGIIPSVETADLGLKAEIEALIKAHCDTTAIDADGLLNLYGMQRLGFRSIVEAGEVLWLRRTRRPGDGLPLNFQVQMLEPEYLDDRHTGLLANGNDEFDGIEFDLLGRRVNYRLYREHPEGYLSRFPESRKVRADQVIHAFEVERAGQRRGVPWLAPVMSLIADGHDYMDAQLLKQKLAAMFVAFTRDTDPDGADVSASGGTAGDTELFPGMFEHLPPGRDVTFSDPPKSDGYSEHMALVLRMIASGRSLTYEALSGDLSGVNFSSARMGRMEMNRAMSAHQWLLMVPQVCQPFEVWLRERLADVIGQGRDYRIKWTPPRHMLVDPAREIPAMLREVEGGLSSRSHQIRSLGYDPEDVDRERAAEIERERRLGLLAQEVNDGGGNG